MLLREQLPAFNAVAQSLDTTVEQSPRGTTLSVFGVDQAGMIVSLRAEQITEALDVCGIVIIDPKRRAIVSVASLVNGRATVKPDNVVVIEDVRTDRFSVGPKLAATIELGPRDAQL